MNKTLKFSPKLVPLILSGEKISTWRLWNDKDLSMGDIVELLESGTDKHFATARLTKVIEKPMGQLTEEDKKGHENFNSDKEMYATYLKYYGKPISPDTLVKIIKFKLI